MNSLEEELDSQLGTHQSTKSNNHIDVVTLRVQVSVHMCIQLNRVV